MGYDFAKSVGNSSQERNMIDRKCLIPMHKLKKWAGKGPADALDSQGSQRRFKCRIVRMGSTDCGLPNWKFAQKNSLIIIGGIVIRLSWYQGVWVPELVRGSLERILTRILERFGGEGIKRHGLDQYGGLTNVRMMRGSTSKISRHSFGIAIDIDPVENSFRTPWPDRATMPIAAIRFFEEEGWTSFARVRGFDAMHFQATSNYVGN